MYVEQQIYLKSPVSEQGENPELYQGKIPKKRMETGNQMHIHLDQEFVQGLTGAKQPVRPNQPISLIHIFVPSSWYLSRLKKKKYQCPLKKLFRLNDLPFVLRRSSAWNCGMVRDCNAWRPQIENSVKRISVKKSSKEKNSFKLKWIHV